MPGFRGHTGQNAVTEGDLECILTKLPEPGGTVLRQAPVIYWKRDTVYGT